VRLWTFSECFGFGFGFLFFLFFFFKPGNIVFSSSCEEKYISMFSNTSLFNAVIVMTLTNV